MTRTTIQSDNTVVPPVTALLSPPASRITGADSPVIALSSTDAAPSMTSPSAGICSPALTITSSPFLRNADFTSSTFSFFVMEGILWAVTSFLDALKASAWAFPLPSAIASAKLAKRTVNHRMIATPKMNPAGASWIPTSDNTNSPVVRIAETYTRNMTGFFASVIGDSFMNESLMALFIIFPSARLVFFTFSILNASYPIICKCSAIGPNESAGKKLNAPTSRTMKINNPTNIALQVDKVPAVVATCFFLARLPAMASTAIIGTNLTRAIISPREILRNGVSAPNPANAEPLLPPADE